MRNNYNKAEVVMETLLSRGNVNLLVVMATTWRAIKIITMLKDNLTKDYDVVHGKDLWTMEEAGKGIIQQDMPF